MPNIIDFEAYKSDQLEFVPAIAFSNFLVGATQDAMADLDLNFTRSDLIKFQKMRQILDEANKGVVNDTTFCALIETFANDQDLYNEIVENYNVSMSIYNSLVEILFLCYNDKRVAEDDVAEMLSHYSLYTNAPLGVQYEIDKELREEVERLQYKKFHPILYRLKYLFKKK